MQEISFTPESNIHTFFKRILFELPNLQINKYEPDQRSADCVAATILYIASKMLNISK